MDKALHIITLDIPSPPDYGGAVDMYYKLKALHLQGVHITLHCFQYGKRKPAADLETFAAKVHYYPRLTGFRGLDRSLPYIISSRRGEDLLKHLLRDEAPILFEGIHTTYYGGHALLKDRCKLLRTHNVESDYYSLLAEHTGDYLKKTYFQWEALRLKTYENSLPFFDHFLHISKGEQDYFSERYPVGKHHVLPAFHAANKVDILAGMGNYCLYHGNLKVPENEQAALFLANQIMPGLDFKLIIAGKNPGPEVMKLSSDRVQIVPNPDDRTLDRLIREAQVNVLPFFQLTGVKLKLLHALFHGRHCLVNELPDSEVNLKRCVVLAPEPAVFRQSLVRLMQEEFTSAGLQTRCEELKSYCNGENAAFLASLL